MNDIESRDQIIEDLSNRVDELEDEVERLKAHTWQQERSAVVDYIIADGQKSWPETKRLMEILAKSLENGEHWQEGERHDL